VTFARHTGQDNLPSCPDRATTQRAGEKPGFVNKAKLGAAGTAKNMKTKRERKEKYCLYYFTHFITVMYARLPENILNVVQLKPLLWL